MKKMFLCALAALLTLALTFSACASVEATPTQRLALRTGPSLAHLWVGYMPETTPIRAFEYERGSDVVWVLVEYESEGKVHRGYLLLDRMTIQGAIPWAKNENVSINLTSRTVVYTAPSARAAQRSVLPSGEAITLLSYEGDYAYIEFYDTEGGALSRGYVDKSAVKRSGGNSGARTGTYATPNQRLSLRTGPNTAYTELYTLPETTQITAYEYEKGNGVTWVLVEYMLNNERVRAYTGLKRMTVHGDIPWANHLNQAVYARYGCEVLAAPASDAAARARLNAGASVTLLEYDGSYALIEYIERNSGQPERGYVALDGIYGYDYDSNDDAPAADDSYWDWDMIGE